MLKLFNNFPLLKVGHHHRVIILNRGSMFTFQWRESSPPLNSAHRQKRDRRRCNSRGIPPQPPTTRVINQWPRSPVWRHAVKLHTAVGKNCITFFTFFCEACSYRPSDTYRPWKVVWHRENVGSCCVFNGPLDSDEILVYGTILYENKNK